MSSSSTGMPDISGIELPKWMSESDPTAPLILFTLLDTAGTEVPPREPAFVQSFPKTEVWRLLTSIETAVRLGSN
jgi:hypothetical protein